MGVGLVMPHDGWNDRIVRITAGTLIGLDAALTLTCETLTNFGGFLAASRQGG